jgi:protein tyrosine/serine phosphatase
MYYIKSVLFILLLISFTVGANPRNRPSTWATAIINSELENFYKVSDKVYRSEQPNAEAMAEFEYLGINTVLNLRKHHNDNDEGKDAKVDLKHIKMAARNVTNKQIYKALSVIKLANGPVVVHCYHGSDRTGVVIAAYRMVFQNWSSKQAVDEFKNGGYGYHEWVFPNLIELLENLNVNQMKKKLAQLKESPNKKVIANKGYL